MIRDLTSEDTPQICDLLRQTQLEHATENPNRYRKIESDRELTEIVETQLLAPRAIAIGFEMDRSLVGYLLAIVSEIKGNSTLVSRSFAMINEIAIQQDHRRQGIASLLLEELKNRAKNQGISMIRAAHGDFNKASAVVLERHGFEVVTVTRELYF